MNLYKRKIYKKSLQHAERRNHKYLYKIGDRYIYPEDVAGKAKTTASNIGSMASAAGTAAKTKINKAIADQKQKHKDRVFTNTTLPEKLTSKKIGRDADKYMDQLTGSHQKALKKIDNLQYMDRREYDKNVHTSKSIKNGNEIEARKQKEEKDRRYNKAAYGTATPAYNKAIIDTDFRKKKKKQDEADRKNKSDQQRKSAHAGYEADKKAFPEGGSTEELERQKTKTKARKSASNRFNELDQKNKKRSNNMEPDIQKQHSQINSAHQMATERRMVGNSFSDKKWNRQNLYSVNYYDQSGSIERQKRKTALRKRHKK